MIKKFMGVEYSRGATATIRNGGPALAPKTIQKIFPNYDWTIITPKFVSVEDCAKDRFGDTFDVHEQIYSLTPNEKHIFIGGDHSVNFSHFAYISDQYLNEDICLVYFDAHFDIHSPESSIREATGSPHGTNVRHLLGEGDNRWLGLCKKTPSLKPENLFYFGSRSFEPSEEKYVKDNNIFYKTPDELKTAEQWEREISLVKQKIGNKKYIVSFDFDGIDPKQFSDVWVPEANGLSLDFAKYFIKSFKDAINFEFVEYAPTDNKDNEKIVKDLISIIVNL